MEFTKDIGFNQDPTVNKELEITYNGFLSNSNDVWIVYGFGESWEYTSEIKMEKYFSGFSAKIKMLDYDKFNFCFKNNENQWDNNNSCNYITQIAPELSQEVSYELNINELISEMLKPISSIEPVQVEETTIEEITSDTKPIDLGVEVTNALSQIENTPESTDSIEYSSVSEVLSGSVFDETPIEIFVENKAHNESVVESEVNSIIEQLIENTQNKVETIESEDINENEISENIDTIEENNNTEETSLSVSIRKLSKFYLAKKRIKLTLYKAFIKLPKMLLGLEDNN